MNIPRVEVSAGTALLMQLLMVLTLLGLLAFMSSDWVVKANKYVVLGEDADKAFECVKEHKSAVFSCVDPQLAGILRGNVPNDSVFKPPVIWNGSD